MEQATPQGPTRLGRYTLIEPLGEGGMAKVFFAKRDGAADICVLKQLHVQLEQNSEAAKRFIREANIASQLRHPNIASIVDAGMEDGRFCLAMEFISGQTVEAMVKKAKDKGGILPLEISIPIILRSLEALEYAHELLDAVTNKRVGLVHRDLSPRNIMLDYGGMVKLIDFGIAKGDVDEYKTQAGVLMGTPYYMSPEQARALSVDHRSDLYTLGVVFFEMLTGKRLVQAKGRAKILMTVARQLAPPISSVNPNVPKELDPILAKALAKAPEERYASAQEFASALRLSSGEYAFTDSNVLGAFLRDLFPEAEAKTAALLERVRYTLGDGPAAESTRAVLPSELDGGGRTRTGYVDPSVGFVPAESMPQPVAIPAIPTSHTSPVGPALFNDPASFDPTTTNLASRVTVPPSTSLGAKLAVAVLAALIAAVGAMLYRVIGSEPTSLDAVADTPPPPPAISAFADPIRATTAPPPPPPPPPPVEAPAAKATKKTIDRIRRVDSPPPPPPRAPPPPAKASPNAGLWAEYKNISTFDEAGKLCFAVKKQAETAKRSVAVLNATECINSSDLEGRLEKLKAALQHLD